MNNMIRHAAEFVGLVLVVAAYLVISLPLLLVASAVSTTLEFLAGAFDLLIPRRGVSK